MKTVKGDLFTCPPTSALAHCVSVDMHMGKGIATIFKKRFGRLQELWNQNVGVGGVAVLMTGKDKTRPVYYLVTKTHYYGKPTYQSLEDSLVAMKTHLISNTTCRELSIPRLGCGLDGLSWSVVRSIIDRVFAGTGVEITLYEL